MIITLEGLLVTLVIVSIVYLLHTRRNNASQQKVDSSKTNEPVVVGEHVVVIGGGIGGLVTAAILSNRFKQVTLIERDKLPSNALPRPGVPQSSHFHVLLDKGRLIIEKVFPGFTRDCVNEGAFSTDLTGGVTWWQAGGFKRMKDSGIQFMLPTRILIESVLRKRLLNFPNVTILDGHTVLGFERNGDLVSGVVVRKSGESDPMTIEADLVVDCGGRNTKTLSWLTESFDIKDVEYEVVDSKVGYTSGLVNLNLKPGEQPPSGSNFMYISPSPPRINRSFVVHKTDIPNQYLYCFLGNSSDYPPTSVPELKEYAKGLERSKEALEWLEKGEFKTFNHYRKAENFRRFPQRVSNWPSNLVLVGDSLCYLNPAYGQGVTSACQQAECLDNALGNCTPFQPFTDLASKHHEAASAVADAFWKKATFLDYNCAGVESNKPIPTGGKLKYALMRLMLKAQLKHADATVASFKAVHMISPPPTPLNPKIAFYLLEAWWNSRHEKN